MFASCAFAIIAQLSSFKSANTIITNMFVLYLRLRQPKLFVKHYKKICWKEKVFRVHSTSLPTLRFPTSAKIKYK